MKIAIVGPSPVPFTIGGMENMIGGLYSAINEKTPHQAEIIKIPSREHTFWDLIETYYQFYTLDLRHFDAIVVSKYPAWMVQHDNCIFYVAHRLRGLYDTYHLMSLPYEVPRGNAHIDALLAYMEANPQPMSLEEFFQRVFELRQHTNEIGEVFFQFPGPFIRKLVHYMDNFAFQNRRNAKYLSISNTVKGRKGYFPENVEVDTLYLPTAKIGAGTGKFEHIFMVSRLDAPKRIDVLVKAMKYVKSDIPLYIAGTGPEKERLEALAGEDPRIHFIGFVSDDDVENYYANSLVIPYFPYEEDYGLITIEAMLHHKPVITAKDAGGPTEFVVDGETGFIVDLEPRAIAEKIDYMANHPMEARNMGENAYTRVKGITWDNVVQQLFAGYNPQKRKKITVTSTFGVYPPQGGGQARIFNLYKELAAANEIEIISYVNYDQPATKKAIAPHLVEYQIPRDTAHQEKIWKLEAVAKLPLTDVAEIQYGNHTAAYCETLKRSIESSDVVVISHPYLYETARPYLAGRPFIYEAQDVESVIKEAMLPPSRIRDKLVSMVFDTEKACCDNAVLIMACSEEDRQKLHELYGAPLEKIIVVPNGVDTKATRFCGKAERLDNKMRIGLEHELIGIFVGSWHEPNLEACEVIFQVAERCPNIKFMLMGSQCNYFAGKTLPPNVGLLGLVSEEEKRRIFDCADFAMNPMLSGSGTNLKMFDYMAAGLPIITTEFGTRGIEDKSLFVIANTVDETVSAIREFAVSGWTVDVEKARRYVEDHFDWSSIAKLVPLDLRP